METISGAPSAFKKMKDKIFKDISNSILSVGFSTMLIAISTTAFFSLSPFYLKEVLGVSIVSICLIENVTEALSQLSRLISGVVGDYLKRHKPMFLLGTIFSALARPLFVFASGVSMIIASKAFDRLGNGISATPRDAYVAQNSPADKKGACIGIVMTFKTIGCVVGPWFVMTVFWLYPHFNYKLLLIITSIPSFIAVIVCIIGMKDKAKPEAVEQKETKNLKKKENTFKLSDVMSLSKIYWAFLGVMGLFYLARVPESYMLLALKANGLPMWFCSGAIGFFNLTSVMVSYPAGKISDRLGRSTVLMLSFAALAISLFLFAVPTKICSIFAVLSWGIQRSTSQILSVACISDIVPEKILGTAIGLLNISIGFMSIAAGLISGLLQKHYDFSAAYYVSSVIGILGLGALMIFSKKIKKTKTTYLP